MKTRRSSSNRPIYPSKMRESTNQQVFSFGSTSASELPSMFRVGDTVVQKKPSGPSSINTEEIIKPNVVIYKHSTNEMVNPFQVTSRLEKDPTTKYNNSTKYDNIVQKISKLPTDKEYRITKEVTVTSAKNSDTKNDKFPLKVEAPSVDIFSSRPMLPSTGAIKKQSKGSIWGQSDFNNVPNWKNPLIAEDSYGKKPLMSVQVGSCSFSNAFNFQLNLPSTFKFGSSSDKPECFKFSSNNKESTKADLSVDKASTKENVHEDNQTSDMLELSSEMNDLKIQEADKELVRSNSPTPQEVSTCDTSITDAFKSFKFNTTNSDITTKSESQNMPSTTSAPTDGKFQFTTPNSLTPFLFASAPNPAENKIPLNSKCTNLENSKSDSAPSGPFSIKSPTKPSPFQFRDPSQLSNSSEVSVEPFSLKETPYLPTSVSINNNFTYKPPTVFKFSGMKIEQTTQTPIIPDVSWPDLWKILECPVCLMVPTDRIVMCKIGHNVCHKCRVLLDKCPCCQNKFSDNRSIVAEQIIQYIPTPCRYQCEGCESMLMAQERKQHELLCVFRADQTN